MYLAASPPLFSPLMGSLDVNTGRSSSSSSSYRHHYRSSSSSQQYPTTLNSIAAGINALDFDFGSMTLSPALIRSAAAAESSLFHRRSFNQLQQQQQSAGLNRGGSSSLKHSTPIPAPLRSCLAVRLSESSSSPPRELSTTEEQQQQQPPSPTKKRVVFADDKGLSLTQIKMMTEPSDCPPRWTAEFLEQVTGGASAEVAADRWELSFAQPASDYLDFRSRLDKLNLSLENVVLQEADQQLVGTVKVKNLAFSKQVTVRITFDNWQTQTDFEATFATPSGLQGGSNTPTINLFDTFSFKIPIPTLVPSNRIQFCVRFTCEAGEFWDNNGGKNYVIVKPVIEEKKNAAINGIRSASINNKLGANSSRLQAGNKYSDIMTPGAKVVDYWAEFASWNHLVNDSPYW